MNYLFFDIECCDGTHMCSFGYALCDEKFNIIKSDDILINPEAEYFRGMRKHAGFSLAYTEAQMKKAPAFPQRYEFIKNLLTAPDQINIGHAVYNDAGFIKTACDRYALACPEFEFCDTQSMFKTFAKENAIEQNPNEDVGLDTMTTLLDLQVYSEDIHRSDADAVETMHAFSEMVKRSGKSVTDFIKSCGYCTGGLRKGVVTVDKPARMIADENFGHGEMSGKNRGLLKRFLERISVTPVDNALKGKKVVISYLYENGHFPNLLKLIERIMSHGGIYCKEGKDADIFMTYYKKRKECLREKEAREYAEKGKKIQFVTLEELIKKLGFESVEQLESAPIPAVNLNAPAIRRLPKENKITGYRDKKDSVNAFANAYAKALKK
ncbi:MAG: hypothetical protein IJX06_02410 [Clostridia bacterium]|nr:hypothetical protein [Clostridia bacterium]